MYREPLTEEMMDKVDRLVESDDAPAMLFMRDEDGMWWGIVGDSDHGTFYVRAPAGFFDGLYEQLTNNINPDNTQGEDTSP